MVANFNGISFYFFDFDDNIMSLGTPIFILNTVTKEPKKIDTGEFPNIHPQLGKPGQWENYDMFDGSYLYFRDIPENELQPGQKQYFVEDVEKAIELDEQKWQAPSWNLFVHACEKQHPVSIITARGHSPKTLKTGVSVLVNKGLIPQEPNYHTIFPVGNDKVRIEQLCDAELNLTTPLLKRRAIIKSVEQAFEQYGSEADLRFGMSDDDPQNINLIIRAMCECKKKYIDKRFFAINTHLGEKVKLEVFPVDFPVASQHESELEEPLA